MYTPIVSRYGYVRVMNSSLLIFAIVASVTPFVTSHNEGELRCTRRPDCPLTIITRHGVSSTPPIFSVTRTWSHLPHFDAVVPAETQK